MTPLKPQNRDELIDAVKFLTEEVQQAGAYLSTLVNILDNVKEEISWIINNRDEMLPLMIRSLPADPCDPKFGSKVRVANGMDKVAETVSCVSCDVDSPYSLADALTKGWTRLQKDDGPAWNFLGLCPCCQLEETVEPRLPPKPVPKSEKGQPKKTLF
jgi:hypothetical protein